jgi:glutamate synthase (NADPH/NADH) small chain
MTKKFSGVETRVTQLHCCKVEWIRKNGSPSTSLGMVSTSNRWKLKELPGTDFIRDADVVLLAMGFLHVTHNGLVKELVLDLDESGNPAVNNYQTNEPSVFAAGDTINGASLVVRAINSGREAAAAIDDWLKKQS